MRLEWDLSHWLSLGELLLLLELLVASLDGDGKTDLGLLLWARQLAYVFRR